MQNLSAGLQRRSTLAEVLAARFVMRKTSLPDGDPGIAKTVAWMDRLASGDEGAASPRIRSLAVDIVRGVLARDRRAEMERVYTWVKQNIEFRNENEETLQTPLVTLQLSAGDCDDFSMLIAALLRALGHEVRFQTIALQGDDPTEFTHVFPVAYDRGTRRWISLDATVSQGYPGWLPGGISRSRRWPSAAQGGDAMAGLGRVQRKRLGDPIVQGQNPTGNESLGVPLVPAGTTWKQVGQTVFAETVPVLNAALANKIQGTSPYYFNAGLNTSGNSAFFGPGGSQIPTSYFVIGGIVLLGGLLLVRK